VKNSESRNKAPLVTALHRTDNEVQNTQPTMCTNLFLRYITISHLPFLYISDCKRPSLGNQT